MTSPLTITFTLMQGDNILERGGMLSDAQQATLAFLETMKAHKPTVATAEGAALKKERKARVRHPVAERGPEIEIILDSESGAL